MATKKQIDKLANVLTQELAEKGNLIVSGFAALRQSMLSPAVTEKQLTDFRITYFAAAEHVFTSLLAMMENDGSDEPSKQDLDRMERLHDEVMDIRKILESFVKRNHRLGEDNSIMPMGEIIILLSRQAELRSMENDEAGILAEASRALASEWELIKEEPAETGSKH